MIKRQWESEERVESIEVDRQVVPGAWCSLEGLVLQGGAFCIPALQDKRGA